jgi:hypothetical protein
LGEGTLTRIFDELASQDREDGLATGLPQGFTFEAHFNSSSQGVKPEDTRKNAHIRGRSRPLMKYPG